MQLQTILKDLSKEENIQQLSAVLTELAEQLDTLYTETAPNGNISGGRIGRIAIYNNSGTYTTWLCVDGSTTWQQIDLNTNTFLGLTDTPSSFSDQAGKYVKVNSGEDALEFGTIADTDEKAKVSSDDTTAGYLNGKLTAGDGISLTEGSGGGDETLAIANTKPGLSNVIFNWNGCEAYSNESADDGFVISALLNDNTIDGKYSYIRIYADTLTTILTSKFTKISGISTVTVWGKIWSGSSSGDRSANLKVDIGGANVTLDGGANNSPTWISDTIDVSGLSDGTTYDITIQLASEHSETYAYCIAVILIAS